MTRNDKISYYVSSAVLAASCLIVLGVTVAETAGGGGGASKSVAETALLVLPDPTEGDAGRYAALLEKPLFSADRRSGPAAPAEDKHETLISAPTLSLTVLGTMIALPKKSILIKHSNATDIMQVDEGQSIDGWVLVEVRKDGAVFRSGDTTQVIYLPDSIPHGAANK